MPPKSVTRGAAMLEFLDFFGHPDPTGVESSPHNRHCIHPIKRLESFTAIPIWPRLVGPGRERHSHAAADLSNIV